MAREINLVPDVKNEMIKALKLRNLIFFICIVVVAGSIGVSLIFFSIATGQNSVINGKKSTLEEMSNKISSYSDLSDFLTIKDQLGNLSSIAENKNLLSRTFGVLSAIIPTGADTITISELSINLEEDTPTFSFDAQANAGKEPYIDYNVLDSFKKSMQYMRYDYGNYVDKEGNIIPSYCMVETGSDGATLSESGKGRYAYWLINGEGCNPAYTEEDKASQTPATSGYETEDYDNQKVVKIWRTPQYDEWYQKKYMTEDGTITGVAHFESACITYSGNQVGSKMEWTETNDTCLLVPDGTEGIVISDSSNGRDASEELVLRFHAVITFSDDIFKFTNKHLLSLGPSTRYNVTDSYVQVQHMFEKRASDCAEDDTTCKGEQ